MPAAFPAPDAHRRRTGAPLPALDQALVRAPLRLDLRAAAADEPWRTVDVLTLTSACPAPEQARKAAYSGSRHGRGAVAGRRC